MAWLHLRQENNVTSWRTLREACNLPASTPEHRNICLRHGEPSCEQLCLDVSQQQSLSSVSKLCRRRGQKSGCMPQSHRRSLHLPSSHVPSPPPSPPSTGNCGGGRVFQPGKDARERHRWRLKVILEVGWGLGVMGSGGWSALFGWTYTASFQGAGSYFLSSQMAQIRCEP